jgi:hypothetical protein
MLAKLAKARPGNKAEATVKAERSFIVGDSGELGGGKGRGMRGGCWLWSLNLTAASRLHSTSYEKWRNGRRDKPGTTQLFCPRRYPFSQIRYQCSSISHADLHADKCRWCSKGFSILPPRDINATERVITIHMFLRDALTNPSHEAKV